MAPSIAMTKGTAAAAPGGFAPAELVRLLEDAAAAADTFVAAVRPGLASRIAGPGGKVDRRKADQEQHALHGLAWFACYAELMRQVADWARRLAGEGRLGEVESLLALVLFAEYGAQLRGGVPMNLGEIVRPADLAPEAEALARLQQDAALDALIATGSSQPVKSALAARLAEAEGRAIFEDAGLDDTLVLIRDQFHAFSRQKVAPFAHQWHCRDELIPLELVQELADLGVFGMTIPERYGGLGMGKTAMCVVAEELSRGWIGVGSLGTRSEIAGELILSGGLEAQKQEWLPRFARGEILPTAVFTEPDTGSDLAALKTKALPDGDAFVVNGAKTWITHAARADLMTLLVRTDPESRDHRGLSMLLAPKPRGTAADPFPAEGMSGGEIPVIGYRGMKEYEIAFDGFRVPAANLLGGAPGQGFHQLMRTFESARIQTAARAVGVGQAALDAGLRYAQERRQFGRPIFDFPRVSNKLAVAAAELMGVRQLTYYAARRKDEGKRCDLEAGMAKLLAARIAWSAADNALQIHGGAGFAVECVASRLLADARILNIFEGAGEIQAQVIARRLLDPTN